MISNTHEPAKDEVSLIELWDVLWQEKLVVLAFCIASVLFGALYLVVVPDKFNGTLDIQKPDREVMSAFAPVNDQIKEQYEEYQEATGTGQFTQNQFEIVPEKLLEDFVREFQDGEELEEAVLAHSVRVQDMTEQEFQERRLRLLESFQISLKGKETKIARLEFDWHDEFEAPRILAAAISETDKNVRATNLRKLRALSDNLKLRRSLEVAQFTQKLGIMAETIDLATQRTLLILEEQAAIARELDIENNALDEAGQVLKVVQAMDEKSVDKSDDTSDHTFGFDDAFDFDDAFERGHLYLRGYKALEKEAALIRAREQQQGYVTNGQYLQLKAELLEVEKDITPEQLQAVIEVSPFAKDAEIFFVNALNISVEDTKKPLITLLLALVLGAVIGSVYVLMRQAAQVYRSQKATG